MTEETMPAAQRRSPLLLALCVPLLCAGAGGATAVATAQEPAPLPKGVVARVEGRELSFAGLCLAAAQQKLPLLKRMGSNATTILRGLIERRVVDQEARRLGITVTAADVEQRFKKFETEVRRKFRGQKTLQDLMHEQNTSMPEFREELEGQILKERIARHPTHLGKLPDDPSAALIQIEIVIDKVVKRATIRYGVPTALSNEPPAELDPSWVCAVKSDPDGALVPVTMQEFGHALVLRLPSGDVRKILDVEIKTALLSSAGYRMSEAAFEDELALQRRHWKIQRELASQAAVSSISYDDWIEAKFDMKVEEMKRKRYWRGYFALLGTMRESVTEEEVRAEYEAKRKTHWGDFILVTEVRIEFAPQNARFARRGLRSYREAQQAAREIPRLLAAGTPFEQIVRDINARRDPTFRAQKRRLRPNTDDFKLWERAEVMKDGDLSSPFETLSHVHLLRREAAGEAPPYEDVRVVVAEAIARRKAREWINEQVKDPKVVRVRWPLPQREG